MAAHARALMLLAQRTTAAIREGGPGGSIVAISSLGARRVYDAYAAFGTAKAAVEALVRYLAVELGPEGITVNCVAGGVVVTDLFRAIPIGRGSRVLARSGRPCARCSIPRILRLRWRFLLSDAAGRITGQTLVLDAGFTLPG